MSCNKKKLDKETRRKDVQMQEPYDRSEMYGLQYMK
jgi:hypothetical protein